MLRQEQANQPLVPDDIAKHVQLSWPDIVESLLPRCRLKTRFRLSSQPLPIDFGQRGTPEEVVEVRQAVKSNTIITLMASGSAMLFNMKSENINCKFQMLSAAEHDNSRVHELRDRNYSSSLITWCRKASAPNLPHPPDDSCELL